MSYLTPTTALGAGLACFGLGVTRRVDTGFRALGVALCALAFSASPAFADQFVEAVYRSLSQTETPARRGASR